MRNQAPPGDMISVLAAKSPLDRLASICNGLSVRPRCLYSVALLIIHPKVLDYEYLRQFGMTVADEPLRIQARVINAPTLKYHQSSQQSSVVRILFLGEKTTLNIFIPETREWCMESVCPLSHCRSLFGGP